MKDTKKHGLVLTRKPGEAIIVSCGDSHIVISVAEISPGGTQVRIRVDADPAFPVNRSETSPQEVLGVLAQQGRSW